MEIGVLGPLTVEDSGRALDLGGRKQRTVLARLIVSTGIPVSTDELVMAAYGADAEPKVRRSVQTYVSMLRRVLGDALRRERDGYVLDVAANRIDAHRFEDALARAKAVVDTATSADLLADGLRLWRGAPYADVEPGPAITTETSRLHELHAEAIGMRIEADLRDGRHREVLAELETMIAIHPHREELRAHHMLALYRSGRQADALQAFRDTEDVLRDDFGLDPSPALRSLEQRILEQDPTLDFRPRPTVRSLPARFSSFIGREAELDALADRLSEQRLVTITGPGGIGKSSLAVEVARSHTDRSLVVYVPVDAAHDTDLVAAISDAFDLLGEVGPDTIDRVAESIGDTPTLLVLDGCERLIDQVPAAVGGLLRAAPSVTVLVTSREPASIPGETVLRIGGLGAHIGEDLFAERAGLDIARLNANDRQRVADIVASLASHPLSLELAAARVRTMTLSEISEGLADQGTLLTSKRAIDDRHGSITAAISWSYDTMPDELQRVFRHLCVFRGPIQRDGAAAVLGHDVTDALRALVDLSMIEPRDESGAYGLLEPIRQYGETLLETHDEAEQAHRRYLEWLIVRLDDMMLENYRDGSPELISFCADWGAEIEHAAAWARDHDPELTLRIVAAVGRRWLHARDPSPLRDDATTALGDQRSERNDVYARAMAYTAWLYSSPPLPEAHELLARLDDLDGEVDDPVTRLAIADIRAALPHRLNNRWLDDGILDELARGQEEYLALRDQLGWPVEPALYNHSLILAELGRFDDAEAEMERIWEWAGDTRPFHRAHVDFRQVTMLANRGAFAQALECANRAAQVFSESKDIEMAMDIERNRMDLLVRMGRADLADRAIERHDELADLVGYPHAAYAIPDLVALVDAANSRFEHFALQLDRFLESAPDPDTDPRAWIGFLEGRRINPAPLVLLLCPVIEWLMATGRIEETTRVAAAAPMAYASTKFTQWDSIGELERFEKVSAQLDTTAVDDPPETLGELFSIYRELIHAGSRSSPGRESPAEDA